MTFLEFISLGQSFTNTFINSKIFIELKVAGTITGYGIIVNRCPHN